MKIVLMMSSNEPIEDYHSELFQPTKHWSFFAILDGHAGWNTAAWLSEQLLPSLSRALQSAPPSVSQDAVIARTFLQLDREIVDEAVELALASTSQYNATRVLERANSGSCAIVAFYDSQNQLLKVANTGDSRAILGRRTTTGDGKIEYAVKLLSFDHNGDNKAEVERLNALHPGEDLFKGSRYIGWGCSRAFGDGRTKWSKEIQDTLLQKYLGSEPAKTLKTPPYFTAEPEVTTTKIEKGDILIIATDGLWECLTNDEAVGLVGRWIERQSGNEDQTLPVKLREVPDDEFCRYKQWRKEKCFAFVDGDTPAQHLLRNALGGADEDLRQALLNLRSPRSRGFR
jgi:pyruvate dehydrogenase phosphatase